MKKTYSFFSKCQKYVKDLKGKEDSVSKEPLDNIKLSWRSGYLKARKDIAKVFKMKKYYRKKKYNE